MINPTESDIGRRVVWTDGAAKPRFEPGILKALHRNPDGTRYVAAFVLYDGAVEPVKTPLPDLSWE